MTESDRPEQSTPVIPNADGPSSFVTSRPVAILMLFIAAVVFGYFSYERLPVTLMPELTYPTLTVRTEYPGSAPEEVENDISRPVEEALGVIGGLQQISSISRAEVSDVVLEFDWAVDVSQATQDVLERLDLVFLPDEARRPLILHFDPALDPVMEISLTGQGKAFEGEQGLRRLRRIAEYQVSRALEPIRGIAAVRVKGGLEEEIHVLLDEAQLRRTGVSIQAVIDRLRQENINVAGGTIQEGRTEYLVRTLNEYENLGEISETIVTQFEGRDIRVRDLGTVSSSHRERQIVTRTDGGESVQIEIYKEADANIVALAKRVKARIGQRELVSAEPDSTGTGNGNAGTNPGSRSGKGRGGSGGGSGGLAQTLYDTEGVDLSVVADRSLFIESSIQEVRKTAIVGGLLAIVILFMFLRNLKPTVIIAVSIPISLLITFAPLNLLDVSLNIMSLGGLALGIGMLVDSSIVVLESIHRCREEGDTLIAAAIRGTEEVRSAVLASTLTSIAVFFPMVFVEGVAGQAFGDLGITVVVSLLASAVVALFLIPMLASRGSMNLEREGTMKGKFFHFHAITAFIQDLKRLRWKSALILPPVYLVIRLVIWLLLEVVGKLLIGFFIVSTWVVARVISPVFRLLLRFLAWMPIRVTDLMMGRLQTLYPKLLRWSLSNPTAIVSLIVVVLLGTFVVGRSLESELLPEVRQGEFTFEVALPVGTPLTETDAILGPIEQIILTERENIEALILTLGFDPAQSDRSDEGEHTAMFKVLLDDASKEDQVIERLRLKFARVPDLDARVTRPVLFSSKMPIELEVHGDDLLELRRQSERVVDVLASLPELADVQSTLQRGAPEVQVVYDRDRLSRYGLNIGAVARLVRDKVQGFEATKYNLTNRRIPILVRLADGDRETVADVENLIVNPGGERPIPLGAVAAVSLGEGPSEVRRIDGRRVALVRANIASGSLSSASDAIVAALEGQIDWPEDMTYLLSGQNQEWERSRGSLFLALALSIFLVYVIMAAQFESLVHPFTIMFTIPLAFVGTMLAIKLLGIHLSVVVFLGMIMLAGIVVNNAIVLVDYINTLRARGLERTEAIVEGGSVRLRPILMTTATTVLGLTPMALGFGDGSEIRTPMAIAVISGLITSTVLTLFIIPTVYQAFDGFFGRFVRVEDDGDAPTRQFSDSRAPASGEV